MADVLVPAPGSSAAPLDYLIPGAQEIVLKALEARFNGAAAAAAFYPCVQLIAPGNITGPTFKTRSSVAAGGSADVTFGPFLDEDAAASTSTVPQVPFALASDISSLLVAGTVVTASLADSFYTSDASLFSTAVVTGKTYIRMLTTGIYRLAGCCIADDAVDTGPLVTNWHYNFGLGAADESEYNSGTFDIGQITFGGLNRWLIGSDTFIRIRGTPPVDVTMQVNCANITGNISGQHTDVLIWKMHDDVAGFFI